MRSVAAIALMMLFVSFLQAQDPSQQQSSPQDPVELKQEEAIQKTESVSIQITPARTADNLEVQQRLTRQMVPPEEVLKLDQAMKDFVDERISRSDPPVARLRRLVQEVFSKDALNFEYEWGASNTARDTFRNRTGNCLSYTNMFVAMARYLGVDVRFHEVRIVPSWEKRGNMIYLSRHINVLAYAEGQAYEVDLFPSVSRHRIGGRVISDERGLAHFYSNMGAELMSRDYYFSALAYFKQALELDPEAGFVWGNLGVAHSRLGENEEAERAYLKALSIEEDNVTVMHNLARLYERQGQRELASDYLGKVEKFRQRNPYYHYQLGLEALEDGRLDEAYEHLQAAVKRKKQEDLFHFALAKVHAQLGHSSEVVEALETALHYATNAKDIQRYNRKLQLLQARYASNN